MAHLEYKSLVTKETIDYYLSKMKDDDKKQKKDLINTVSKFDIRISTKPIIEEEEGIFYYKIWIWRRGTKKRAHIKLYNKLELLKKEESKTTQPSFRDILNKIRVYADVPEDFEEYCEISFRDPSDETSRTAHPRHLKRAERFKNFMTTEEIRSIPLLPFDDKKEKTDNDDEFFDLDDQEDFIPLKDITLKDKKEYDKLKELQDTVHYHAKIVESYGYDPHTGDYDLKKFPITKEDKQKDMITKDFKNYFQALEEYNEYLKELIKKYDIKPTGNLVQRLIFMVHNDVVNANVKKQQQDFDLKYIMVAVDWEYFS